MLEGVSEGLYGDEQEGAESEEARGSSVSMTLVEMVNASPAMDENDIHFMRHGGVKEEWDIKEKDRVNAKVWGAKKRTEPMYEWRDAGVWRVLRGERMRVPPVENCISLICEFHDRGHYDCAKTVSAFECNFGWNDMGMHVDKYCKDCGVCALASTNSVVSPTLTCASI